jgi:hypothetical protein
MSPQSLSSWPELFHALKARCLMLRMVESRYSVMVVERDEMKLQIWVMCAQTPWVVPSNFGFWPVSVFGLAATSAITRTLFFKAWFRSTLLLFFQGSIQIPHISPSLLNRLLCLDLPSFLRIGAILLPFVLV